MNNSIQTLNPYPAYKDSGVPWLGEVPAHWQQLPGKACYREKKIPNTGLKETTVLSLSYGQIVIKPPEKLHGLVPASFETYQIVDPGDIIIRPTDLQNDWNSLRFGLSRHRGIITSAYMCFHAQDVMTREYGYLLLHTYDLKKVFYGLGSGLRQNLDWTDFKYLPCFVPPLPEQRAIARFLDHHDQLTRRYIRAQRCLITLLTEQKQALIQQAVTRGLDPDVPLKDSGIEWLGEIPEHWGKTSIKRLFVGMDYGTSESLSGDGIVRVLTMGHIQDGEVVLPESGCLDEVPPNLYLDHSDLLFNRTNSPELVGKVGIFRGLLSDRVSFASYLVRLRVRPIYNAEYISYLLNSPLFWSYARSQALISLHQANLNATRYGQMLVPLPPPSEQATTASYLNDRIRDVANGIAATNRQIDLIREYRTRLIADVVTGKLDVRQAAAHLPEEAEEPEELDEDTAEEEGDEVLDVAEEEVGDADD